VLGDDLVTVRASLLANLAGLRTCVSELGRVLLESSFGLALSGTTKNEQGNSSSTHLQRDEVLADFSIDYGLPGNSNYGYRRPFDYFAFQITASSANAVENLLTRGLLIGDDYHVGRSYRGVWGLYGSYDYIAPQTYRVSSTAASLGTTVQWWANDSVAVLGTACALLFSVANVFFRDFSNVVSLLTMFVTFSVPMIYPYSLVAERFGAAAPYYLLNPVAEAVLLFQRCFWVGTTENPAAIEGLHMPRHLFAYGFAHLAAALVALFLAQKIFTRLENKIPERL